MEPTQKLNSLPAWMAFEETEQLIDVLSIDGHDAPRFVGGCVRDVLVNRTVYDFDLATPLLPEKVMELLEGAKIKAIPTGLSHGTVTAVLNKIPFEITTLRKDIETDGRHAKVRFTSSWEEDAARRDLTFNALFCDREGNVYDYHNGVQDLHAGRVRFIGDASARIQEDILRILRFFRFFAHYGRGEADEEALAACAAHTKDIQGLSKERVTYEFLRLLEADQAAHACQYMVDHDVMPALTGKKCNTRALEKLIRLERDWDTSYDAIRRVAVLMREHSPMFHLSNVQKKHLAILQDEDLKTKVWSDMPNFAVRQFVYDMGHDVLRDIVLLKAANEPDQTENYLQIYQAATRCRLPKMPVIGNDVIELGVDKGKQVGDYLRQVETWWRDKDFRPGRTECLNFLKSIVE